MAFNPKTPTHRRGRSNTQTPLTASLVSGLNAVSFASPSKPSKRMVSKPSAGDLSNPFIARPSSSRAISKSRATSTSRPASPVKRATSSSAIQVTDALTRQANSGVIRKGGIESRMNIITNDYVPLPKLDQARSEMKRSRSTPSIGRSGPDRFITTREADEVAATLERMHLEPQSASPGHTARLAKAAGVPLNKRVLAYHEAPPPASSDPLHSQQRELAKPLYARPGALPSSTGAIINKSRKISTHPERVLDAPNMMDDFYLNPLSWGCTNNLAVALGDVTYIWNASTGVVTPVGEAPEASYISAVEFSNDGAFLGVGLGTGDVELWDAETRQKLRTMGGHQAQVGTLSWNGFVLSSGCGDGSIWHHDVRIARHKVMELLGHHGEVCGLKWRQDGELLASGGNDNVVNIWDNRIGDVDENSRNGPKWTKRNHTAAVKALAWCPWQPALLASGGGTNDASVNIWNSTTGARLHTLKTPAQVTSVHWSLTKKEFVTTHGFPTKALMVHSYPSLACVAEIRDAHDTRVLYSSMSPAGDLVCTAAGDDNLKFWRIWEVESIKKKKSFVSEGAAKTTDASILAIR